MSKKYYEHIVDDYKNISDSRRTYIKSVDQLLINYLKDKSVLSWLDIGCGDGSRTLSLQKDIKSQYIEVVDNEKMLEKLKENNQFKNKKFSLVKGNFTDVVNNRDYDLITFLWNVLGHAGNELERVDFLKKAASHLKPEGIIFFDINNRYNLQEYGVKNVDKNIKCDLLNKENAGSFKITHNDVSTNVYIHHPYEIECLIKKYALDLQVVSKAIVNYASGQIGKTIFDGQLVYLLKHEDR